MTDQELASLLPLEMIEEDWDSLQISFRVRSGITYYRKQTGL